MTIAADPKQIWYDHGDYRAEYDGLLIGFYPTRLAAEAALNDYAYDIAADGMDRTAGELDAPIEALTIDEELATMGLRAAGARKVWATDECKLDVQGNRWLICGAPGDEPCMCDMVVRAAQNGYTDPETGYDADDYADEPCPCGAPAIVTIRESRHGIETIHYVCDPCFQREFQDNEENYAGWEVVSPHLNSADDDDCASPSGCVLSDEDTATVAALAAHVGDACETLNLACLLAGMLAHRQGRPAHVVVDDGHFLLADSMDIGPLSYWRPEQILFTAEPFVEFCPATIDDMSEVGAEASC